MWCLKKIFTKDEEAKHELQRQRSINKEIEKQIRKDKRKYRATHRLQIVGLQGSGKSTLIQQLRLLEQKYYSDERRREKLEEMREAVKVSIVEILAKMAEIRVDLAEEENEEHRKVVLETAAEHEEVFHFRKEFFESVSALWKDPHVQAFYEHHTEDGEASASPLAGARYFLDKADQICRPSYLPTDEDILRLYCPTTGIQETSLQIESVTFCLFEVNAGQVHGQQAKWIQHVSDSVALLFVVDMSSYDAVGASGLSRLHEALLLFESVWNHSLVRSKSVILFLNKLDAFEGKIRDAPLSDHFPLYDSYKVVCPQAHREWLETGADPEVLRAKYFVRDLFLEVAVRRQSPSHQCYPYFTCAINTGHVGKLINECCRDILQREHLRMHEIL